MTPGPGLSVVAHGVWLRPRRRLSVPYGTIALMAATASPPPTDYEHLLVDLQRQVQASQLAGMRAANAEMLNLFRAIGRTLLQGRNDDWSAEVIERLGADLRARFPQMTSLSAVNLRYMQKFTEAWPDPAATPPLDALPWGHIRLLLDKVDDSTVRDRYAVAAVRYGWSYDVLLHQLLGRTHHTAPPRDAAKARVQVDFHLSPDGSTLAQTSGVSPPVALAAGDLVEAHDGDIARLAVVDSVEGEVLSLTVLWDTPDASTSS